MSTSRVPRGLRALTFRNYRLFWGSAIVSNAGSQMQLAALGWVVAVETGSAMRVALVAFAGVVPLLVLSPLGGSLADRFARRRLFLATQTAQMLQAFALWGCWAIGWRGYWLLFAMALLGGVLGALNAPVWQAFVPELVPRHALANAVMLNSTQFNIAKAVGPMVAGIVLAAVGAGLCFFLNALSFVAVLAALLAMRLGTVQRSRPARASLHRDMVDAWRYLVGHRGLVTAVSTNLVTALVGQPVIALVPVLALDVFGVGSGAYGVLAGALGVGSIAGAWVVTRLDSRRPSVIVVVGALLYAGSLLVLGVAPGIAAGVAAMVGVGAGFLAVVATNNSAIQSLTRDDMRGRVLAIWLAGFGLANPVGVIVQGWAADRVGLRAVVVADGLLLGAWFAFLALRRALRHLDGGVSLVTPAPVATEATA